MTPNRNFRSYSISCSVFFLVWGVSMLYSVLVDPTVIWYDFPVYDLLSEIMAFWLWGIVTTGVGVGFLVQSVRLWKPKRSYKTRSTIVLTGAAACITMIWTVALMITFAMGLNSPLSFLLFAFCTMAHFRAAHFPIVDEGPDLAELREAIAHVETLIAAYEIVEDAQ